MEMTKQSEANAFILLKASKASMHENSFSVFLRTRMSALKTKEKSYFLGTNGERKVFLWKPITLWIKHSPMPLHILTFPRSPVVPRALAPKAARVQLLTSTLFSLIRRLTQSVSVLLHLHHLHERTMGGRKDSRRLRSRIPCPSRRGVRALHKGRNTNC
jgi:hypothetical protein